MCVLAVWTKHECYCNVNPCHFDDIYPQLSPDLKCPPKKLFSRFLSLSFILSFACSMYFELQYSTRTCTVKLQLNIFKFDDNHQQRGQSLTAIYLTQYVLVFPDKCEEIVRPLLSSLILGFPNHQLASDRLQRSSVIPDCDSDFGFRFFRFG